MFLGFIGIVSGLSICGCVVSRWFTEFGVAVWFRVGLGFIRTFSRGEKDSVRIWVLFVSSLRIGFSRIKGSLGFSMENFI